MGRIRVLDPALAGKIAAGEVVERPASVVKELLENSLDSGATVITITLAEGGRRLIKVADNGCGISGEDAPLVFLRHSTSKISAEEDLSSIKTLGFRGEALSSISTVSKVEIRTRERGEVSGTSIRVEGGDTPVVSPCGQPEGTEVSVKDLFFNIPVRRKFLRSPESEYARVLDVFKRTALINPAVSFRLFHGSAKGVEALRGSPRERITGLLGGKTGDLVEVQNTYLQGFVGTPGTTYATGENLYTYVNGRPVRDRTINRAVLDGYGALLQGRYPLAVLDLRVPFEDVDVNIHPAKTEVRFKNPGAVYHMVRESVRAALSGGVRSGESLRPVTYAYPVNTGVPVASDAVLPVHPVGRPLEEEREARNPEFLRLTPVGQLWGEFLVAESGGDFYLIDQHGAEERCAFEMLKKDFLEGRVKSQMLLLPERVETSASEREALSGALPYLERFGFELSPFGPSTAGGETFIIKSVPWLLPVRSAAPLVKDLAMEMAAGGTALLEGRLEEALMRIACHSVIRGPRTLSREEGTSLLRKLAMIDFSGYCPHGRPVVKRFSRKEVESFFRR